MVLCTLLNPGHLDISGGAELELKVTRVETGKHAVYLLISIVILPS